MFKKTSVLVLSLLLTSSSHTDAMKIRQPVAMPGPDSVVNVEEEAVDEAEKLIEANEGAAVHVVEEAEHELEMGMQAVGINYKMPNPKKVVRAAEGMMKKGEGEIEKTRGEQDRAIKKGEKAIEQEEKKIGMAQLTQPGPGGEPPKLEDLRIPPFLPPVQVQYDMLRNVIGQAHQFLGDKRLPGEIDRILNNVREEVKKDANQDLGPPPKGEEVVGGLNNLVDNLDGATKDAKQTRKAIRQNEKMAWYSFQMTVQQLQMEIQRGVEGIIQKYKIDMSNAGKCETCDAKIFLNILDGIRKEGGLEPIVNLIQNANGCSRKEAKKAIKQAIRDGKELANDEKKYHEAMKDFEREAESAGIEAQRFIQQKVENILGR